MRTLPTPSRKTRALRRALRRRLTRGQSMVEYSIVSHALLLLGGGAVMGISQYLKLFEGLDIYLRSLYTVLAMGAV
ncbi:MAG: hypothetical protein JNJ54_09555 [Myxococcaceae bacterium]|nr:hypothetical protein [Myxococcaceae bacterium]